MYMTGHGLKQAEQAPTGIYFIKRMCKLISIVPTLCFVLTCKTGAASNIIAYVSTGPDLFDCHSNCGGI